MYAGKIPYRCEIDLMISIRVYLEEMDLDSFVSDVRC